MNHLRRGVFILLALAVLALAGARLANEHLRKDTRAVASKKVEEHTRATVLRKAAKFRASGGAPDIIIVAAPAARQAFPRPVPLEGRAPRGHALDEYQATLIGLELVARLSAS